MADRAEYLEKRMREECEGMITRITKEFSTFASPPTDTEALNAELNALRNELSAIKVEHAAEMHQMRIQHKIELVELEQRKDLLYKELETEHSTELAKLKAGFGVDSARQQEELKNVKEVLDSCKAMVDWALEKYLDSERERKELKPILDVGATTRLRYLEKSKRHISDNRVDLDQDIIEKGNIAAHQANGAADLALALGGYIEGNTSMEDTLRNLYKASYDEWRVWPSMLQEGQNWLATLRTIDSADYHRVTINMEVEVDDMWGKLLGAYHNYLPNADFEENLDNRRVFERMKELKNQNIYLYRNSYGGPRSCPLGYYWDGEKECYEECPMPYCQIYALDPIPDLFSEEDWPQLSKTVPTTAEESESSGWVTVSRGRGRRGRE